MQRIDDQVYSICYSRPIAIVMMPTRMEYFAGTRDHNEDDLFKNLQSPDLNIPAAGYLGFLGCLLIFWGMFKLDHLAGVDFSDEEFSHEVQSDLWGQLLDVAFVSNAKKKPAVGWFEWRNTISQEILAKTLDCQARHTLVPPETLLECGKYIPQARWLFLVSIYRMRFIVDNIYGVEPQHAYARNIWMKFNVYDLKQGCSIWESNVVYKGKRQAEPTGSSQSIKRWQTVDEGELPNNVMTKVLSGPPLRPTLDEGLIALLNPIFTTGPDPDEGGSEVFYFSA